MDEMEKLWAIYFVTIAGIQHHPRNQHNVDLQACATIADQMLDITTERIRRNRCQSDQQHLSEPSAWRVTHSPVTPPAAQTAETSSFNASNKRGRKG